MLKLVYSAVVERTDRNPVRLVEMTPIASRESINRRASIGRHVLHLVGENYWPRLALDESIIDTSALTVTLWFCCPTSSLMSTTGRSADAESQTRALGNFESCQLRGDLVFAGIQEGMLYSPVEEVKVSDLLPVCVSLAVISPWESQRLANR